LQPTDQPLMATQAWRTGRKRIRHRGDESVSITIKMLAVKQVDSKSFDTLAAIDGSGARP
jgi:hypothetical protein